MRKLLISLIAFVLLLPVFAVAQDDVVTTDMREWMRTYLMDEGGATYTDAVCDRILNLRIRWYASTFGIMRMDTIETVDGQLDYALNADYIKTNKVGMIVAGTGREKALAFRAYRPGDASLKTYGHDGAQTHPLFYNVIQGSDSYYLKLDPAENESTTDTVLVYYEAFGKELTEDTTQTNIPYNGIHLIIMGAVVDGLILNKDNPTTQIVLPFADKMFQEAYQLHKAEVSDPIFDASR